MLSELNLSNVRTATLGLRRIGPRRELKAALKAHWSGKLDEAGLMAAAAEIRAENRRRAVARDIAVIQSNDFSLCDHVLDTIIGAVAAKDADVISIETSHSRMELLGIFVEHSYPAEVGPSVWDIHSPRVPSAEEMMDLVDRAREGHAADQRRVNQDCGLKTRGCAEVRCTVANMAEAARRLRSTLGGGA